MTAGHLVGILAILALGIAPIHAAEIRIGTITIVAHDVFSKEEAEKGSAYRATNKLHIQTRERVVRRFLLFREGDEFIASKLEESERNLRELPFIQSASVTAGEPHDGVLDVVVVTQDAWSTQPGASLGSAGGKTDFGLEIEETNFLGLGKQVTFLYQSDVERTGYGLRYRDPAAFGRYWDADLFLLNNSDGNQVELSVQRPFYSFATPWAVKTGVADRTFNSRIYSNGVIASEFGQVRQFFLASYGIALNPNNDRAHRISSGIDWQSDEFSDLLDGPTTILPSDREFRYLFVDYEYEENRFVKRSFVDRDFRYEDFQVGTLFRLRAGVSPALFGVDDTTGLLSASVHRGFELGPVLLFGDVLGESRVGAENDNALVSGEFRLIRQYEGLARPQTTLGRIAIRYGSDLDADRQLFADGASGLRGYRLYAFEGDKSIVMNLEHRLYLGKELWQFLSPGLAVFVDAGNASYDSSAFDPGELKVDAGVGLRLGLTRTPRNVFRFDFAYAFDEDPLGRKGWLISFSSRRAF